MTLGGLLRHFRDREAEAPKSVRPWLAVARKASRLQTIGELVRLRNFATAVIDRLTAEAL